MGGGWVVGGICVVDHSRNTAFLSFSEVVHADMQEVQMNSTGGLRTPAGTCSVGDQRCNLGEMKPEYVSKRMGAKRYQHPSLAESCGIRYG